MVIIGERGVLLGQPSDEFETPPRWQLRRLSMRVANLQDSVRFLCDNFGFFVHRALDSPLEQQQPHRSLLAASEDAAFFLELIEDPEYEDIDPGDWFSHITVAVPSTKDFLQRFKASGHSRLIVNEVEAVIPVRSPSPDVGGQTRQDFVSLVKDINGYTFRVMDLHQQQHITNRVLTISLRTTNLERSISWCKEILGARVHHYYEASQPPEYKTALVGLGPELETVQLELRQTALPPLLNRGNGVVRIVVTPSTTTATTAAAAAAVDVAEIEAALDAAEEPFERVEIESVEEIGGVQLGAVAVEMAPDGQWEFCFVAEK